MHTTRTKEMFFGCAVGVFCMFLFNSYIIAIDPLGQCAKLTENQASSFNATTTAKPQTTFKRDNCTTEIYNAANAKAVNDKISNNGSWPYSNSSEVCTGNNSTKCLPAFIEIDEKLVIYTSKTSKTGICTNFKAASQLTTSLSCMLDDPLKFFYGQNDLVKNALERPCGTTNLYQSVKEVQELGFTQENNWKLATVVREPLERFVSGFIYICLNGHIADCKHDCNDCGVDINCFLDRATKKFEKMIETKKFVDEGTIHLMPQNWNCQLRDHLTNYTFLKFHSDSAQFFDSELKPFLQSQNVSDQALNYIRNRMTLTRTKQSNTAPDLASFLQNKIQSSPEMLEKFLRVFYHDYTTFNFPFPELIK